MVVFKYREGVQSEFQPLLKSYKQCKLLGGVITTESSVDKINIFSKQLIKESSSEIYLFLTINRLVSFTKTNSFIDLVIIY